MEKTYSAKPDEVTRNWLLVDLENEVLGRAASKIAQLLRGKHKPQFTPHVDTGDFVVVINAAKVKLTGKKWKDKMYYKHSGYMGSLKSQSAGELREKHPDRLITYAVTGMLPKNKLADKLIKKLKVFPGSEHTHSAQKPQLVKLSEII
jgi:large subunit ribosomal protein L13